MRKCSNCRLRIDEAELKASSDELCPRCGNDMTPSSPPSDHEEAAEIISAAERALLVAAAGIEPPTGASQSTETCAHVMNDGDVCGRSMPCRYKTHAVAE